MKPINFDKIDNTYFVTKDGIKRRIAIGTNDWVWIFSDDHFEPNVFRFSIDWTNSTFDVLTALNGFGTIGKTFPEHTGLKIERKNYVTQKSFIKFISDWVNDNLSYLHINVR